MTAKVACCPEGGLPRPSTAQMGGARSNHDSRRSHMQYRTLGRTGIKVSPYALGALMLGASIGNPDHDDSIRLTHKALDAGINLIDTADAYSRALPRRSWAKPSK